MEGVYNLNHYPVTGHADIDRSVLEDAGVFLTRLMWNGEDINVVCELIVLFCILQLGT